MDLCRRERSAQRWPSAETSRKLLVAKRVRTALCMCERSSARLARLVPHLSLSLRVCSWAAHELDRCGLSRRTPADCSSSARDEDSPAHIWREPLFVAKLSQERETRSLLAGSPEREIQKKKKLAATFVRLARASEQQAGVCARDSETSWAFRMVGSCLPAVSEEREARPAFVPTHARASGRCTSVCDFDTS